QVRPNSDSLSLRDALPISISSQLGGCQSPIASSCWGCGCAIWTSVGPLPEKFLTILGSPGTLASEHTPSTRRRSRRTPPTSEPRSEEHTSELQSRFDLVCR